MEEKERILIRRKSRIFSPEQYMKLREQLNPEYRMICDGLINTGARMVEQEKILKHKEWYNPTRRIIDLPEEGAAEKHEMLTTDRTIYLTSRGVEAMDALYSSGVIGKKRSAFFQALKRAAVNAGMDARGVNPKSLRKTTATWLMESRKELGIDTTDIAQSLGHDVRTLMKYYAGTGFNAQERKEMVEYFRGWKQ